MSRLFGTNGIRGVVGREMTASLALNVGRAVGTYFQGGTLAVGNDTRTSSPMLKAAMFAGLSAVGCEVEDIGTAPSPSVQYYVKTHDAVGGVIITASHNPREFNGIKVLDSEGMELSRSGEEAIEDIYFRGTALRGSWDSVGKVVGREGCNRNYMQGILNLVNRKLIRESRLRVILDCANGASCLVSPYLLGRLGCRVTTVNGQPDGTFPGHPPEPRKENVKELLEMVADLGADLGAVHDGDADRIVFVDEKGRYVHGDRSLALVAGYVVRRKGGGLVVTPVSSSSCVEDVVRSSGGQVIYTKVGAPLVARTMYEKGAVFGGEENGGLIFPEHQHCRDGAMGLAVMLEIVASEGVSLSKLLSRVPTYRLIKSSVPCPPGVKDRVQDALLPVFEDREVETIDGLKVRYEHGWVLIRPSGTEPIFRIFSEGRTKEEARKLNAEAVAVLRDVIDSLKSGH